MEHREISPLGVVNLERAMVAGDREPPRAQDSRRYRVARPDGTVVRVEGCFFRVVFDGDDATVERVGALEVGEAVDLGGGLVVERVA